MPVQKPKFHPSAIEEYYPDDVELRPRKKYHPNEIERFDLVRVKKLEKFHPSSIDREEITSYNPEEEEKIKKLPPWHEHWPSWYRDVVLGRR